MSLTIDDQNIKKYRRGTFPTIECITWKAGKLNSRVLRNFINLTHFYCHGNNLTSISQLRHCHKLQVLHCSDNRLTTLRGLENCKQLTYLHCASNQLINLNHLSKCKKLEKVICFLNKLTDLQGLNFSSLEELDCSHNYITHLNGLENCLLLKKLNCNDNKIISLRHLKNCVQLRQLACYNNPITSLQGLEKCFQLQYLNCNSDNLTTILPIMYLPSLRVCFCSGNTQAMKIQEKRFIDHINLGLKIGHVSNADILKNLLRDPEPSIPKLENLDLRTQNILDAHCKDPIPHSRLHVTYKELLAYVWARIERSMFREDMINSLEKEIKESSQNDRFDSLLHILEIFSHPLD